MYEITHILGIEFIIFTSHMITSSFNVVIVVFSLIPGTQKIWMKTWGCSHNNSDGEYMAGQLAASGYKMTGK